MQKEQLLEVMKFHLSNFNDENAEITNDTKPGEVLSETDGFGSSNSADIFRYSMGATFKHANVRVNVFPDNWLEMSLDELSTKLLEQ